MLDDNKSVPKNNFLLSPGALQRTESTLSLSFIKSKKKPSLSNGPHYKIQEEIEEQDTEEQGGNPQETL
jgi:hypothetical protein